MHAEEDAVGLPSLRMPRKLSGEVSLEYERVNAQARLTKPVSARLHKSAGACIGFGPMLVLPRRRE